MASSATEDARKIAAGGPGLRSQLQRLIDRMLNRHRLAERVFLGPDGQLTPAAIDWLDQLARENFVEGSTYLGDRDAMLIHEGRRRLALEIIQSVRLDVRRLDALTKLERETTNE